MSQVYQDPKPRKPRRNRKYIAWVATKPCLFCGAQSGPPHHDREIGPCGMGTKPSDTYCLPVCASCHDHIHNFSKEGAAMLKRIGREERMFAMLDQADEWMRSKGI